MRDFPLPSVPAAAATGLALGFYPASLVSGPAIAAAFIAAAAGIVLCVSGPAGSMPPMALARRSRSLGATCLALAVGLLAGAILGRELEDRSPSAGKDASLRVAGIEGRLSCDSAATRGGYRSYLVQPESLILASGRARAVLEFGFGGRQPIRVLVRGGAPIDAGARVALRGDFRQGDSGPVAFALPGEMRLLDRGSALDLIRSGLRDSCRTALKRAGRDSAGLLEALLIGVQDDLELEDAAAFKAAGCSHILALSGQHLSVLAVLALACLRPLLGPFRARFGAAIFALAFMWLAGAGPSLLRSVLMVWIAALAVRLDRPQTWLELLSMAFILALPFDPAAARSPGFTLSYTAILGLALLSPRFEFILDPYLPSPVSKALAASLGAQFAVTPILVFSFGTLQPAGIIASVLAAPLVLALMWWGMGAALLCSALPAAVWLVVPVSDGLYRLLVGTMRAAASVPALPLQDGASQCLASCAVVAAAAFVYARPHAEHRRSLGRGPRSGGTTFPRLRRPELPQSPPRG